MHTPSGSAFGFSGLAPPLVRASCCFPLRYELLIVSVLWGSSRREAERFPDSLASMYSIMSFNGMSWFFSPSRSSCISESAIPRAITLRRISSVKSLTWSHPVLVHFISYLHVSACPLMRAWNDRMGSSWPCRMLDRATRATIVFSARTASVFMAARTSFSSLSARLLPAARVRSFRRSSSQHSSSCATMSGPASLVPVLYSPQRVMKYDQASPVPASAMEGRLSFSILAFAPGALGAAACAVACIPNMAATTTASACSAT